MGDSKRENYEKWINRIRLFVAYGILCCAAGLFTKEDSYPRTIILLAGLAFLVLGIALFFEYLIRVIFFRPGRKLPWYQFSIAGMLIATTCVAAVCAFLKILGPWGIVWLVLGLIIFACFLESWLRNNK
jgi:hypothetical protein